MSKQFTKGYWSLFPLVRQTTKFSHAKIKQTLFIKKYYSNNCIIAFHHYNSVFNLSLHFLIDVDSRRDDDASPLSSYRFMLRPTWMISALWQKSKYKSKFNFDLFWKKLTFGFSCCSTRKDLSIDVSITNVGLISTKPGRFHLGYVQNLISSISNFLKKKKINFFGFRTILLMKTFPLVYQLLL